MDLNKMRGQRVQKEPHYCPLRRTETSRFSDDSRNHLKPALRMKLTHKRVEPQAILHLKRPSHKWLRNEGPPSSQPVQNVILKVEKVALQSNITFYKINVYWIAMATFPEGVQQGVKG